ncbi:MAG: hypothetical protein GY839_00780, partial [candidate division Zixibacteria bacterium]|nr:hypothetical protein [candidate division Zixibacteria bacterium]
MSGVAKVSQKIIVFIGLLMLMTAPVYSADNDLSTDLITTIDTLLFEDFDGPIGPIVTNPVPGWTVIDSGVPEWDATSWSRYINGPYPDYWNGDIIRVLFAGDNAIADWLISPVINCSNETSVTFTYNQRHS